MPATIPPAAAPAAQIAVVSEHWAAAAPRRSPPAAPMIKPPGTPIVPARALSDQRIKDAVAETIAAAPDKASAAHIDQAALRSTALSADNASFARQIEHAKVPGCMGPVSLKFQAPQLGPIVFSGVFTLPFLLVAAARGKCN